MTTKSMVKSAWVENMAQFLYHLDPDTRKITRSLEKNWIKYSKPCSIVFNKTCLNNKLLPKYTIFNIYYHHHHVVPLARISLALSRHFSLSFIASGRSSVLHPVSSHSCWMYVRAGRPAFAQPYVEVHRSTSLIDR